VRGVFPYTSLSFNKEKTASLDAATSLAVVRDDLIGAAVHVVAIKHGKVVARVRTSIGGE